MKLFTKRKLGLQAFTFCVIEFLPNICIYKQANIYTKLMYNTCAYFTIYAHTFIGNYIMVFNTLEHLRTFKIEVAKLLVLRKTEI